MSKQPIKRAAKPAALMPKAERREAALKVALKLAKKVGARRVSLAMIAAEQKVTAPLLFHIFGSRDGLTKAIIKAAKAQGIALPEAAPTVREARAASRKTKPAPLKTLKAPVKPAKKSAPLKKLAPLPKPAAKKVAALLKPKGSPTAPKSKGVDGVKLNAKFQLPLSTAKDTNMPKRGKSFGADAAAVVAPAARKPLTEAQRKAKADRDRARRAAPAPTTPAAKFASLPKPFEASVAAVAA